MLLPLLLKVVPGNIYRYLLWGWGTSKEAE